MRALALVFDTETNGLPADWKAPPSAPGAWPALVQIAWEVWEVRRDGRPPRRLRAASALVQPPPEVAWDGGAERVHGIPRATAERFGQPAEEVLRQFVEAAAECDVLVAHNLAFDKNVVLAALHRTGMAATWPPHLREYCTMLGSTQVLRLPGRYPGAPFKWPRLTELHAFLFEGRPFNPAEHGPRHPAAGAGDHDARYDTGSAALCLLALVERGVGGAREAVWADPRLT